MKKRKLVDNAQHLSRLNNNKVPSNAEIAKKRKKFSLDGAEGGKPGDEYNSTADLSNQEKFLLETKAALKSLSGSWPNTHNAAPEDRYEKPNFENLFEENGKKFGSSLIAQVASTKSKAQTNNVKGAEATNCASIKDVVTLSSSNNPTADDKGEKCLEPEHGEEEKKTEEENKKESKAEEESKDPKEETEEEEPAKSQQEPRKNENPIDNLLKIETECEKIPTKDEKKQFFYNNQFDKSEFSSFKLGEATMPAYAPFDELPKEKIVDVHPSSPGGGKRYTVLQPASADSKAASQIQDIAKIGFNVIQPSRENAAEVDKVKAGEEPPLSPDNPANSRGRKVENLFYPF